MSRNDFAELSWFTDFHNLLVQLNILELLAGPLRGTPSPCRCHGPCRNFGRGLCHICCLYLRSLVLYVAFLGPVLVSVLSYDCRACPTMPLTTLSRVNAVKNVLVQLSDMIE